MSLPEPKPKPNCKVPHNYPLPIILDNNNKIRQFKGIFNEFCVEIQPLEDVKTIISMGHFGKANLSRSYPTFFHEEKIELVRERQFKRRKNWGNKKVMKKIVVVPDSDSEKEIDDYLGKVEPRFEFDHSNLQENLCLGLEEAFFLQNAVKCLTVEYNGKIIKDGELWGLFSRASPLFQENYAVYFYYRSRNWVVKPGIKFGGDLLLYKEGPPFYHASFVVIIDVLDRDLKRIKGGYRRNMGDLQILGLYRLCETAGKELLICQIIKERDTPITPDTIQQFEIREITVKRWLSTNNPN